MAADRTTDLTPSHPLVWLKTIACGVSVSGVYYMQPLLRRRIVYGAPGFAAFIVLWTELPFLLASPPYEYSETAIGLFSVLGAASAIGASSAGRFYDQGHGQLATSGFMAAAVAAFVLMGLGAALAGLAYARLGWPGPMGFAAGLEAIALAFCCTQKPRE